MTSSITKKQSKKTKQNKKKERERNKIKSFTIGYAKYTIHKKIRSFIIYSLTAYILVTNLKKVKKAIVKRIFIGTINYETSFNRITDTGA